MKTKGINHLALVCRDMAETQRFYTGILGMPLVKTVALPDGGQHFFFDCGGGSLLAFFWWPDITEGAPGVASVAHFPTKPKTVVGSMNHVAFAMDEADLEASVERLKAAGVEVLPMVVNHDDSEHGVSAELHPGVFVRSVYFTDPNGVMLEFAASTRPFTAEDVAHAPATRVAEPSARNRLRWPPAFAKSLGERSPTRPSLRSTPCCSAIEIRWRSPAPPPAPPGTGGPCSPTPPTCSTMRCGVFGLYRNPERKIDPVLRELAQTRTGWNKASQFVYSQHCKSLRGLGVDDAKIAAVQVGAASDLFNAHERAVLAYTDCLTLQAGRTPDAVFAALKAFLSDEAILELTYITMLYDMHAVMSRALRTEYDDRDDPITEVDAPEGFSAEGFIRTGQRPA